MKKFLPLILLSLLFLTALTKTMDDPNTVNIQFISSTQFIDQPSQIFSDNEIPSKPSIEVNTDKRYQVIQGVGATLTESSAFLFWMLPDNKTIEILTNLFDPVLGIGLNYVRSPISSCDFSLNYWTYDDVGYLETDPNLDKFQINHDYSSILPNLKRIKKINPDVKFQAVPCTPPPWMKNTNTHWGQGSAGLNSSLLLGYYSVYAKYFVKALQAYQNEGITFETLSIQNAPLLAPNHTSGMIMLPQEQVTFINDYLAPEFLKNNITTKVLVYDFNWENAEYAQYVLQNLNEDGKKIVQGTAFHCYRGNVSVQTDLHKQFPGFSIVMSECTNGGWLADKADVLVNDMRDAFIGPANNWSEVFLKLNIALDPKFGPRTGPCDNCWPLVTIDPEHKGAVTYEADYYSTGAFSKFVKRGARRIGVSTGDINLLVTGFLDQEGFITVIVSNQIDEEYEFVIVWGDQWIESSLPAKNVGAYKWNIHI